MSPPLEINDPANGVISNSEGGGKRGQCATSVPHFAYQEDLSLSQRGSVRSRSVGRVAPAFPHHVLIVVVWGSQPQMIRSNTGRIIAFVQNPKSVWYGSEVDKPTASVGHDNASPRGGYFAVAPSSGRSCPHPATLGFPNLRPEPLRKCRRESLRSQIGGSNLDHLNRSGRSALLGQPALSFGGYQCRT